MVKWLFFHLTLPLPPPKNGIGVGGVRFVSDDDGNQPKLTVESRNDQNGYIDELLHVKMVRRYV